MLKAKNIVHFEPLRLQSFHKIKLEKVLRIFQKKPMSMQNFESGIDLTNFFEMDSKQVNLMRSIANEKKEHEERVLPRTRSSEELVTKNRRLSNQSFKTRKLSNAISNGNSSREDGRRPSQVISNHNSSRKSRRRSTRPTLTSLKQTPAGFSWSRLTAALASAFIFLQGGYKASVLLESSTNASLAYITGAFVYLTFAFACVAMIPPMVKFTEGQYMSVNIIACLGGLTYAVWIFLNNSTPSDEVDGSWIPYLGGSVLLGIGAPMIWVISLEIIGRCAYFSCIDEVITKKNVERLDLCTSRFHTMFFGAFQFHGLLLLPVGIAMLTEGGMVSDWDDSWRKPVYWTMSSLPVAGSFLFLTLPQVPLLKGPGLPSLDVTVARSLLLLVQDLELRCLVPACIANGMVLGFVFGDFGRFFVAPVLHLDMVLMVQTMFFTANAFATLLFGYLIANLNLTRLKVFFICTIFQFVFFITLAIAIWTNAVPDHYIVNPNGGWMPNPASSGPQWHNYLIIFVGISICAAGDSAFEAQLPAVVQTFYLKTRYSLAATANYKCWQSVGFLVQYVLDLLLDGYPCLLAFLVAAVVALSYVPLHLLEHHYGISLGGGGIPGEESDELMCEVEMEKCTDSRRLSMNEYL